MQATEEVARDIERQIAEATAKVRVTSLRHAAAAAAAGR